jgi:hypothetical protein
MGLRPRRVKVLVTQDQCAATSYGTLLGEPECARVAQVQVSGGRRGQAAPIYGIQNRSGMLEKAMRVGAAAPASSMLAKHKVLVPYL